MGEVTEESLPADMLEEKTLALGKWVFNLGGVAHDFKDVLKRFQEAMKHWNDDRGPVDYDKNERDLRELLAAAVREGSRRANVQFGNYNDGWNKWIVPGLVTLVVAGVIGNVVQYAEVASLKTAFTDFAAAMERRVNNLEQRVYRGSP